jgi:hypothetical protein
MLRENIFGSRRIITIGRCIAVTLEAGWSPTIQALACFAALRVQAFGLKWTVDSAGVCVASPRVLQPSDRLGWLGDRLRLKVDSAFSFRLRLKGLAPSDRLGRSGRETSFSGSRRIIKNSK